MIITRGMTGTTMITRGYGVNNIFRKVYAEVLRFKSYIVKGISKISRIP